MIRGNSRIELKPCSLLSPGSRRGWSKGLTGQIENRVRQLVIAALFLSPGFFLLISSPSFLVSVFLDFFVSFFLLWGSLDAQGEGLFVDLSLREAV